MTRKTGFNPLRSALIALPFLAAAGHAQTAGPPRDAGRMRIMVYQFRYSPADSSHRALASTLAQLLAWGLGRDSAFRLMTDPRARRDPSRPRADVQYAVVGAVTDAAGKLTVDMRLLDVQRVHLLLRESLPLEGKDSISIAAAGRTLSTWVHDQMMRLTR
jgi:TolB-like protein